VQGYESRLHLYLGEGVADDAGLEIPTLLMEHEKYVNY
jgi:hypothetical protein